MKHLELIRLLDDHLQAAVLSQDGLPHLSYPPGLLLLGTHLPLCSLCGRKGRKEEGREGNNKDTSRERGLNVTDISISTSINNRL